MKPVYLRGIPLVIALVLLTTSCNPSTDSSNANSRALAPPTPTPTPAPVKIVSGVVKRDGTFIGQGFTVVHPQQARFQIRFNEPFDDVPAVTVQHLWNIGNPNDYGGAVMDTCTVEGVDRTAFGVACVSNVGAPSDRDFSFIAVRSR